MVLISRRQFVKQSALTAAALYGCPMKTRGAGQSADRVAAIHREVVFVDMHAHPSTFHRANVPRVEPDELARYRRALMDVVVCSISTDAVFSGGYVTRDGTEVKRGEHPRPKPGEPFAFTLDRFARITRTIDDGDAVLATSPAAVLDAKRQGKLALLAALEGGDGLGARIENLRAPSPGPTPAAAGALTCKRAGTHPDVPVFAGRLNTIRPRGRA
jgi:hypothetical protein